MKYFVGVRQEEHRMAYQQVFYPQGMMMKEMVDRGFITPDETIALHCVGAIPYYSGLPTIDCLGLTDAHVAHRDMTGTEVTWLIRQRLIGHEKRTEWDYLVQRKVVYLSTNPSVFFFPNERFMTDGALDTAKIPPGTLLAPLDNGHVFQFSSTFSPEYFRTTLNARGLTFLFKSTNGKLIYSPAAVPPK